MLVLLRGVEQCVEENRTELLDIEQLGALLTNGVKVSSDPGRPIAQQQRAGERPAPEADQLPTGAAHRGPDPQRGA